MKISQLLLLLAALFTFASCNNDDENLPLVTPDCVQAIITDLQDNDISADCLSTVKRYTFEGNVVFEVQSDACIDGTLDIIDEDCNVLCVIGGVAEVYECGTSANFYDDAVLVEIVWQEN